MTADYPVAAAPATPEDVLDHLRDLFRDWGQDADALGFDTTTADFAGEWNDTILFWQELARSLNAFAGLDLPVAAWQPVLCPLRGHTVGEVCGFIAARWGTRPAVRPWRHLGRDCLPAGAFLTVRGLLAGEGADPAGITPGANPGPYLRAYHDRPWLATLFRLAPGHLPPLTFDYGPLGRGAGLVFAAITATVVVAVAATVAPAVGRAFLGMACLLLPLVVVMHLAAGWRGPRRVEFAGVRTFRDLAYRLAGQEPRRRIQPTP